MGLSFVLGSLWTRESAVSRICGFRFGWLALVANRARRGGLRPSRRRISSAVAKPWLSSGLGASPVGECFRYRRGLLGGWPRRITVVKPFLTITFLPELVTTTLPRVTATRALESEAWIVYLAPAASRLALPSTRREFTGDTCPQSVLRPNALTNGQSPHSWRN